MMDRAFGKRQRVLRSASRAIEHDRARHLRLYRRAVFISSCDRWGVERRAIFGVELVLILERDAAFQAGLPCLLRGAIRLI